MLRHHEDQVEEFEKAEMVKKSQSREGFELRMYYMPLIAHGLLLFFPSCSSLSLCLSFLVLYLITCIHIIHTLSSSLSLH
jgi:hypothetical protein